MNFEEYLITKKIDSSAFKHGDAELWDIFKNHFEQMHPNSFTAQKLFLINDIRRKYTLVQPDIAEKVEFKKTARPVMKATRPIVKKSDGEETAKSKKPQRPVMKRPKMK